MDYFFGYFNSYLHSFKIITCLERLKNLKKNQKIHKNLNIVLELLGLVN